MSISLLTTFFIWIPRHSLSSSTEIANPLLVFDAVILKQPDHSLCLIWLNSFFYLCRSLPTFNGLSSHLSYPPTGTTRLVCIGYDESPDTIWSILLLSFAFNAMRSGSALNLASANAKEKPAGFPFPIDQDMTNNEMSILVVCWSSYWITSHKSS